MGKLFFPKMAAGNLARNRRFFFPYLLTGLLTVAMFYNITFLTWNEDLKNLPGGSIIPTIMYLGTIVVGLFAVIFLLYTNSFLIKRRQKEIGLYNILGMSKRHIAVVLLWETLYTCLIAILGGLLLGILLSKLLLLLLYKLLFFPVQFGFTVNFFSVGVTAALFAAIYLIALARNLVHVSLSKPVELLRGGNVGEKEPKTKVLLTLIGLGTLGAGYYIAITTKSPLDALMLFFLAVILVIIGTYCLFTAGSIALLKSLKKRKHYYYHPKHFISVSGMLYRMKQNAVGLANICILSTMVLVMLSTCVCMYLGVDDALHVSYPHDITFAQYPGEPSNIPEEDYRAMVLDTVQEHGLTPSLVQEYDSLDLNTIQDGDHFTLGTRGDNIGDLVYTEILTAEGYTALTGRPLTLTGNQVAIYTTEEQEAWQSLTLMEETFPIAQRLEESPTIGYSAYTDRILVLVVSNDQVMEAISQKQLQYTDRPSHITWQLSLDFENVSDEEIMALYQDLEETVRAYQVPQYDENGQLMPETTGAVCSSMCRQDGRQGLYTMYGGLLFLGLFLGALFLMATVLIIYYKQISEGYEDKERFAIMEKVGMSQAQVRASIRSQVRVVFFLPLLGAVIHLAAAFHLITKLMAALYLYNIPLFAMTCLGTVVVFAAGYFVIYHLTARTYYKIVR